MGIRLFPVAISNKDIPMYSIYQVLFLLCNKMHNRGSADSAGDVQKNSKPEKILEDSDKFHSSTADFVGRLVCIKRIIY